MFCSLRIRGIRGGPHVAVSLLVLVAICALAKPAQAVITDTDWNLKISEREIAFRPASDLMAMKSLMRDLPFSRMFARNMPFLCFTNESESASITELKLTIGDDKFHFADSLLGRYAKIGKATPGFSLSSTVEDGGDTLVVNFLNGGLAPGKTVDFQIDIDVDTEFANSIYKHPDYRTVLFDMNGDNLYENAGILQDESSKDNAQVTLTFAMTGMPSVTVGPVAFDDPNVFDGSAGFVNNHLARYGQYDPIRSFALSGGSVVPEPSSLVVALVGFLGVALPFGRMRRRKTGLVTAS